MYNLRSHVADDSKNDSKSSKLSPIRLYACSTFDNSNPFITSSWTDAGYSSLVSVLFDGAVMACELDAAAAEEEAAAA